MNCVASGGINLAFYFDTKFFASGENVMFRLRNNSGFTLAELMVVLGIIAIISALAIPGLIGWDSQA